jgi:hypothetical protein
LMYGEDDVYAAFNKLIPLTKASSLSTTTGPVD